MRSVPQDSWAGSVEDHRARAAVERFLSHGAPTPDLASLHRHHLVTHAFAHAVDGAALCGGREATRHATAIHLHRKAELLPLVRAWRQAGIDVLAVKGFHLAEFVYASPAERLAYDVDLVIPEERSDDAVAVAERCGWTVHRRRDDSITNPYSHTTATLWRAGVILEVHRFVVHCSTRHAAVQRRLTAAAWRASRSVAFGDVDVRELDPCDAVIMGVVLNRAWSDDAWHLRASDYLDVRAIADLSGVTREDVLRRAAELACRTTLDIVLQRCDPWRSTLDLTPPPRLRRQAWNLRVVRERGLLAVEQAHRVARGWTTITTPQLLHTLRVKCLLQHNGGDVTTYLEKGLRSARVAVASERTLERAILASIWAARIVQPFGDRSRLRSIVLFDSLRELGVPATLFLATDSPTAPAWVRLDGRPAPLSFVGRVWDLPVVAIRTPGTPETPAAPEGFDQVPLSCGTAEQETVR